MRHHRINLRLTSDEVYALRSFSGNSDSQRVRSMLHSHSLADAISEPLEQRINDLEEKQQTHNNEINRLRGVIENATQQMSDTGQAMKTINKNVKSLYDKFNNLIEKINRVVES